MIDIRVRLFGKLFLETGGHALAALGTHKTEELFVYLLLHRARQHHREALADLLCTDCSTLRSKKTLRQLLWHLQSTLDAASPAAQHPLLLVDRDWVQINPSSALWLDVDVFERAYSLVENRPGEELSGDHADVLRRATELYQGELLEGWYEDWCLHERERLRNMYLLLLDKLMGYCEAHDQYDSGLLFGETVLRHDRASEQTYRRMMRLSYWAGARSAALHQYDRCVAALRQELGVKPSQRTTLLAEQIRADQLQRHAPADSPSDLHSLAPDKLLSHLEQLDRALNEAQAKVRDDIGALRLALGIGR